MAKLSYKNLAEHELEIYNICIAQGLSRSTATFFAKVYFPYQMHKRIAESNGDKWNGLTQRGFAAEAGISAPAAKRHLDKLIDIGVITRDRYRQYKIELTWRGILHEYRRKVLANQYRDARFS